MLIIIKELYDLAACMFLNHLVMHAAGPFLPGHSAFCLRCFIMYMFHGRIWPGQTLGKRVAGYRMEKTDGTAVDLITLLKRQVIGGFLLEGAAFVTSNYIGSW